MPYAARAMLRERVTMEGHLIDSDILRKAFARIVEDGGRFEIDEFTVGRTNEEPSFLRIAIEAAGPETLARILEGLGFLGAPPSVADASFAPAEESGILPDEFYASTHLDTFVRFDGRWEPVHEQRMDCAIVRREGALVCVKQRHVRAGESVLL